MLINENNYIQELQSNNQKALDYIYSKYAGLVYKVVYDILKNKGDKQDVEECVSDIFISVWNNSLKYDCKISKFRNWLIALSKYKAIDYLRKLSKIQETVELDDNLIYSKDTIENKIIQASNIHTVYDIISSMNDMDKQIFIKHYFLEESIINISKHLNVSRTIVDNRLSRGRKNIKNKWNEIMGRY
ncbi:sigma-70 family RNA polymerase sigma factor [Clostridium botulinum]|uniref:Sigma-70 family RNA polymerase sigma factor n=2 Tax=Clostridium botulinum TaxID=1491 RepID=A0A0L9YD21_CLOBO|nr:sigma-70 family RNA polymerase sigma factor [Clostridium botulinum]KAI3347282.1 sigma-70 family RNA polymerase sigma factor [Clostridium botulinum]KOM89538.1 RNA polymerase sigma70 factor [Clostridium botulinum]KOR61206.1 RNA polymerase subunit sigma-70 [Clostridium botulinum]MCS6109661.1 sigma-70 family RNA polymerase sigma factor [Clostridium botulinum]NFA43507.1 sigma-70 family RNA polymerase sigma factor [Clostridium botulinum]